MAIFEHILLNGRPAGGKSELIDFIRKAPPDKRVEQYHIDRFVELDDFVWLWDKFVEDDIWEELGEPRLYSRRVPHGYVQLEGDRLLDMVCRKFNHIVARDYLAKPSFYDNHTLFIEFARGVADGGLRHAYGLLSKEILERAAIVYISVSYEESKRKNEARYQEALAHSILAHKLPDEALQRFSQEQDWIELTDGRSDGYLEISGLQVPFVTLDNEPELTDPAALEARYSSALHKLMSLYESRPHAAR